MTSATTNSTVIVIFSTIALRIFLPLCSNLRSSSARDGATQRISPVYDWELRVDMIGISAPSMQGNSMGVLGYRLKLKSARKQLGSKGWPRRATTPTKRDGNLSE